MDARRLTGLLVVLAALAIPGVSALAGAPEHSARLERSAPLGVTARHAKALAISDVPALSGAPARSAPNAVAARQPAIVARVIRLSGRRLYAKRRGRLVRLGRGDRVALRELVVLGPATKATFRMRIPRGAGITPATDVMDMARFSRRSPPKASRIDKQYGVIAFGVKTHHTVRLQPRLIEFAP